MKKLTPKVEVKKDNTHNGNSETVDEIIDEEDYNFSGVGNLIKKTTQEDADEGTRSPDVHLNMVEDIFKIIC